MKNSLPIALVLAGAVTFGACSRDTDNKPVASDTPSGGSTSPPAAAADARDHALVRIVHAAPGPAIDVTADETTIATRVSYSTVTPYKEVPAAADGFAIRSADEPNGSVLASNSEQIMGGRHYTLVAFPGNEDDRAEVKVVTDDIAQPEAGRARIRVINASSDTAQVDLVARGAADTLFDDVDFREASGYKDVDPSVGPLEVRSEDGKRVLAEPDLTLEAGRNYTIVIAGKEQGSPRLKAVVIEDRLTGKKITVEDQVKELIATIGENMSLRRTVTLQVPKGAAGL